MNWVEGEDIKQMSRPRKSCEKCLVSCLVRWKLAKQTYILDELLCLLNDEQSVRGQGEAFKSEGYGGNRGESRIGLHWKGSWHG